MVQPNRIRAARQRSVTALLATAAGGLTLWFLPRFTSGQVLDLESVLPLSGDTSGDSTAAAGVLMLLVVAAAALPLVVPRAGRHGARAVAASLVGGFAILTILRCGLIFVPGAVLLLRSWAIGRPA